MISTGLFQCNYSESTKAVFQLEGVNQADFLPPCFVGEILAVHFSRAKTVPSMSDLINNMV